MNKSAIRFLLLLSLLVLSLAEVQDDSSTTTTTDTSGAAADSSSTTPTDTTSSTDTTGTSDTTTSTDTSGASSTSDTTPTTDTTSSTDTTPTTDTTTTTSSDSTSSGSTDTTTPASSSTTTSGSADTTTTTTPTSDTTSGSSSSSSASTSSNELTSVWAGLVFPQVRVNSSFDDPNNVICGGTEREKVHYITTNQKINEFKWYVETPHPNGTCLFRISENIDQYNDSAYVNLIPIGQPNTTADGHFPCGTEVGAESAFYDIPDDIDCDACILEWIWVAGSNIVRQCADITVTGGDDTNCVGLCQNGGICQRGVCVCPTGYSGTYCETAPGAIGRAARNILAIIFFILLAIIIIILIIMLLYWCARKRIQEGEKEQIYQTNKKYVEFDVELPSQPHGVDRPAELVRAESQSEY